MFKTGFVKTATLALKMPKPSVNPITAMDALGARKISWKPIGSGFGSGHKPRTGLKALTQVRRVT